MNKDTIVGIIGAAVLIAAMIGVFAYERSMAAATAADGSEADDGMGAVLEGPTLTGTVAVGQDDTQTANLDAGDVGNVTFRLTWEATNGRDTLKFSVVPPAGSGLDGATSEPTDSGDATLTIRVPEGADASGTWQVTVEFTEATPDPLPGGVPPPVPPPGSTDASVSYTVTTSLA